MLPGTNIMIFRNISAEMFGENIGVFLLKLLHFLKKMITTLVFQKNAHFFAENCQKSQKIVIITSNPGISYSPMLSKGTPQALSSSIG
jgi:hypothetical protein